MLSCCPEVLLSTGRRLGDTPCGTAGRRQDETTSGQQVAPRVASRDGASGRRIDEVDKIDEIGFGRPSDYRAVRLCRLRRVGRLRRDGRRRRTRAAPRRPEHGNPKQSCQSCQSCKSCNPVKNLAPSRAVSAHGNPKYPHPPSADAPSLPRSVHLGLCVPPQLCVSNHPAHAPRSAGLPFSKNAEAGRNAEALFPASRQAAIHRPSDKECFLGVPRPASCPAPRKPLRRPGQGNPKQSRQSCKSCNPVKTTAPSRAGRMQNSCLTPDPFFCIVWTTTGTMGVLCPFRGPAGTKKKQEKSK